MSDLPRNDITPLTQLAIIMHESFTSFVAAGFTEEQALKIIIELGKGNNGRED